MEKKMTFKKFIAKLKEDGFNVSLQDNGYVYQINKVANLDGITLSESPSDYRVSFWQDGEGVQTAVKDLDVLYAFIKNITF